MKPNNTYDKFMDWLEKSDPEFYKKYKHNYLLNSEGKITIFEEGLTDEEGYFLTSKFSLFSIYEPELTTP